MTFIWHLILDPLYENYIYNYIGDTHHDQDFKGGSKQLLVHLAEEVITDDVDDSRGEIVFAFDNNIYAVSLHRGQPPLKCLDEYKDSQIQEIMLLFVIYNNINVYVSTLYENKKDLLHKSP